MGQIEFFWLGDYVLLEQLQTKAIGFALEDPIIKLAPLAHACIAIEA